MLDSCRAISRQLSRNLTAVVAQSHDSCRAIVKNSKKQGRRIKLRLPCLCFYAVLRKQLCIKNQKQNGNFDTLFSFLLVKIQSRGLEYFFLSHSH